MNALSGARRMKKSRYGVKWDVRSTFFAQSGSGSSRNTHLFLPGTGRELLEIPQSKEEEAFEDGDFHEVFRSGLYQTVSTMNSARERREAL